MMEPQQYQEEHELHAQMMPAHYYNPYYYQMQQEENGMEENQQQFLEQQQQHYAPNEQHQDEQPQEPGDEEGMEIKNEPTDEATQQQFLQQQQQLFALQQSQQMMQAPFAFDANGMQYPMHQMTEEQKNLMMQYHHMRPPGFVPPTGMFPAPGTFLPPVPSTALQPPQPIPSLDVTEAAPIYVNAKQYHRILERRKVRAELERLNKLVKGRKGYMHESRHQHAKRRPRGTGGRFVSKKEQAEALLKEQQENGGANKEGNAAEGASTSDTSAPATPTSTKTKKLSKKTTKRT